MRRKWETSLDGLSRRDRRGCEYLAYVPDPLGARVVRFDGDVAAEVADAEAAIARLNVEAIGLADTEALARILLRAEAVSSSRIEGLEVGARRLLRADAIRTVDAAHHGVTAREVLNNVDAMAYALEQVDVGDPITLATLLEAHRRLLAGTHLEAYGGVLRTEQNWIGGSAYNPCSAAYVPPPPVLVGALVDDLCAFCNRDDLPAVAQAAIAHAQFETIHPFVDGNGRTGRALIHLILRRRGLATRTALPISLVLGTDPARYIGGLVRFRAVGAASSAAAVDSLNDWVAQFAATCRRSAEDTAAFERRAAAIEAAWRHQLGATRANSTVDLLLRSLLGTPVVTTTSVAAMLGRSVVNVNVALARLVEAGILVQVTVGRRNRVFEAPAIVTAFTDLERSLTSP